MNQRMSWREIVKAYPDEWIFITDYIVEDGEMKDGIVVAHSKNREEIYSYRSDAQAVGWLFTGECRYRGYPNNNANDDNTEVYVF